jgi:hypothetical protein
MGGKHEIREGRVWKDSTSWYFASEVRRETRKEM